MDEKVRVFRTGGEKEEMELKPGWLVAMVTSCRKQHRAAQPSGGTACGRRVHPHRNTIAGEGCLMIGKEVQK